jgi:hypothetical protein
LREWFGHDAKKWDEFKRRYLLELKSEYKAAMLDRLKSIEGFGSDIGLRNKWRIPQHGGRTPRALFSLVKEQGIRQPRRLYRMFKVVRHAILIMANWGAYWDRVLQPTQRKVLVWVLFELVATVAIGNWFGGIMNSQADRGVCLYGICWPQPPWTASAANFILGVLTYFTLGWAIWGVPEAYAQAGFQYSMDVPSPLLFFSLHLFLLVLAFAVADHFMKR